MKDSHAYEMSGEASEDIEGCFSTIEEQCPENASFKTENGGLDRHEILVWMHFEALRSR